MPLPACHGCGRGLPLLLDGEEESREEEDMTHVP